MSYIGKEPIVGNFQKCDAITTSSTATYNLTVGSVAVFPETTNNCIVSLNGVIQAPTSAYTISGSQIVFASSLTSSDVIDFILILGSVLNIGTVSDGTVSTAKVADDAITLAKMASGTDGNIISYDASGNPVAVATGSDGQVLTSTGAGSPPAFEAVASDFVKLNVSTAAGAVSEMIVDDVFSATYDIYKIYYYNYKGSADASLRLQLRTGAGNQSASNYATRDMWGYNSGSGQGLAETTAGYVLINGWSDVDSNTDYGLSGEITIFDPFDDSMFTPVNIHSNMMAAASSHNQIVNVGIGWYTTKVAATGFRIVPSAGNMVAGTKIAVYGLKV